jgi:hypothetical protein
VEQADQGNEHKDRNGRADGALKRHVGIQGVGVGEVQRVSRELSTIARREDTKTTRGYGWHTIDPIALRPAELDTRSKSRKNNIWARIPEGNLGVYPSPISGIARWRVDQSPDEIGAICEIGHRTWWPKWPQVPPGAWPSLPGAQARGTRYKNGPLAHLIISQR